MNDLDAMFDPRDCGADAGAYVLGALESDEAEAFRGHMAECVVCSDEVATLQAVTGALPMAAPQRRPATALKRRALSRALGEGESAADIPDRHRLRISLPVLTRSIPSAARGAVAAGGFLAAVALTVGAVQLSKGSASPMRIVPAVVINEGQSASAVLQIGSGQAQLVVSHMPAPPTGTIYEVWLERCRRRRRSRDTNWRQRGPRHPGAARWQPGANALAGHRRGAHQLTFKALI